MAHAFREDHGIYKKYHYLILASDMGHRCGYVLIPRGHPYYKKGYDRISIECHGGLTFAEMTKKNEKYPVSGYWIGFDCAHHGDRADPQLMSAEYKTMGLDSFKSGGTIRTREFVIKECKYMIDQLIKLDLLLELCPSVAKF